MFPFYKFFMVKKDKMIWVDEEIHTELKIRAAKQKTSMRGVLRKLL